MIVAQRVAGERHIKALRRLQQPFIRAGLLAGTQWNAATHVQGHCENLALLQEKGGAIEQP